MKLIINADDSGFSKGINYGIYDAYKNGIVTSTTLMMNMSATDHAIELFRNTDIGIGVHLNITSGKPLLNTHEFIVNEEGTFIGKYDFTEAELQEMKNEFIAQIESAINKGINISHLDSHHHVHMWHVSIFEIVKALALSYHLKLRINRTYEYMTETVQKNVTSTKCFSESFYDKTVNTEFLIELLKQSLNEESLEVMVHPGFLCGTLINVDSYREMRMVENSILTSTIVKSYVKKHDIELINYHQL